uniref:Uncharacterized protein n=1 Tax=Anguilla anguilla TaxID=7936 RepID=A0A0E9SBC3_ANGAN
MILEKSPHARVLNISVQCSHLFPGCLLNLEFIFKVFLLTCTALNGLAPD